MVESRRHIHLDQLAAEVGNELVCSDWQTIDQSRVQAFADATGDHQWIHVDVARSRQESPFGTTIVHGCLTLSLLPALILDRLQVDGVAMVINYGLQRVRFPAPLPVGSRVRARVVLESLSDVERGVQAHWLANVEREGSERPVCVATLLVRYLRGA